jgi:hypothetical protein
MLATNAGLLTPVLGDPSPWTPQRLYLNGEAGLYYEPADLTAEKVAWRRNLLTWSEQFDNAAWVKTRSSISANAAVAPDGTTTADKLVEDATASSTHFTQQTVTAGLAAYTFSVYAKAAERTAVRLAMTDNATGTLLVDVNLSTGTTSGLAAGGSWTGAAASIANAGAGWYRITLTGTRNAGTVSIAQVFLLSGGNASYTGDGTSGAFLWGAQLEVGTTASAYQRITDFTSDFLAAFPTHALYQDAAGTTPVTALGQPVGLALDKSRGGLANLGPSRIANGAVGLTGTATAATYNTTTGVGTAVRVDPSNQSFVQFSGLTGNGMFLITVQNTGAVAFTLRTGSDSGAIFATVAAGTTARVLGQANAFGFLALVPSTGTIAFTVLGFNEVPGVHAIQPTSASRPALDARVNLLTFTEQFDNAAWTKSRMNVTANAGVAPDGTTTADLVVPDTTAGNHLVRQDVGATGVPVVASIYAKAAGYNILWISPDGGSNTFWYDLSNGTTGGSGVPAGSIVAVGNGWYRCTYAIGTRASNANFFYVSQSTASIAFTGDGTSGVLLWGADVRLATNAAYPYQRVTTATDYADVGVPRSFLFDGFDDSLYTASTLDLSSTDKVTVWAGVYKNSDATLGILLENTATSASNVGVFAVIAPTASSQNFLFRSMGSLGAGGTTDAQFTLAAPVSRVVTGIGDISGDLTALRLNGAQVATNTGDQGTGNYANAVLFIGRRNNTNLPFNGKLYIPVVRGAQTDAATLALTDRYVGSRMGIVL